MKLVNMGKGSKIHNLTVSRNVIVTPDISKIDSLIEIQENGEIIYLDANGNEVHTPESYAAKITLQRQEIFKEIEHEISQLTNEITQAKLNSQLNELKLLPSTMPGQWDFKDALKKFKDFASDLGAKVVAEVAMKQLGY